MQALRLFVALSGVLSDTPVASAAKAGGCRATKPPPPNPTPPPAELIQTRSWVGAEYTPARAVNQLWWVDFADFEEEIQAELRGVRRTLGATAIRVFLHDVAWAAEPTLFAANLERFLAIAANHSLSVGIVFFDDAGRQSGAQSSLEPGRGCRPVQGRAAAAGCWFSSPQQSERTAAALPKLKRYVQSVVAAHRTDRRVLWWSVNATACKRLFSLGCAPMPRCVAGLQRTLPRQRLQDLRRV